jgi:hypothetical protein
MVNYEIDKAGAAKTAENLFPDWYAQRSFALLMDKWAGPNPPMPPLPKEATPEFKELQKQCSTPWLNMVTDSYAEVLVVEDHRPEKASDSSKAWTELWRPNGLALRQTALYLAALKHGQSYMSIVDGVSPLTGNPLPVMRAHSASRMTAFYDDAGTDEFPEYALLGDPKTRIDKDGNEEHVWTFKLYDKVHIYSIEADRNGHEEGTLPTTWEVVGEPIRHGGRGICPINRYVAKMDNEGNVDGMVNPFIRVAARIDQSTFDRLVVQRFGAWRVRWATGLMKPATNAEERAQQLQLMQNELLVSSSPDTKFGTMEPTSVEGYIRAREADIRDLAGVSKVPPHYMLGLSPNLSAEALAAAEAAQMRVVGGLKTSFAESHEQSFRIASYIQGDKEGQNDYSSKIIWRDIESRSLAQIADALGKIASQLKVPVQLLWERIPGWTSDDNDRALALLEEQDNLDVLKALAEGAATQPPKDAPKEPGRPPADGGGGGGQ